MVGIVGAGDWGPPGSGGGWSGTGAEECKLEKESGPQSVLYFSFSFFFFFFGSTANLLKFYKI
jgi:hypothetical protein